MPSKLDINLGDWVSRFFVASKLDMSLGDCMSESYEGGLDVGKIRAE